MHRVFRSKSYLSSSLPLHFAKRGMGCCHWFQSVDGGDDIWQVDTSTIKFGRGALLEVGKDAAMLGMKRVAIVTDPHIPGQHLARVKEALKQEKLEFSIFDQVKIEPDEESLQKAIDFARDGNFDGYISLGGGSVIDTCKAANLYATYPPQDFLDYVNPPIGRGLAVPGRLRPHIACPTTSGTGSESTGLSIFELRRPGLKAKTGIATRAIRPDLGVVDPETTFTLPSTIVAASGFDALSHACESLTARPFSTKPAPSHPRQRPMSQGSNPFADIGCVAALKICGEHLVHAVQGDTYAREQMMLASTLAGISFGNSGCHLPHAMSYSVSGLVETKHYHVEGYPHSCNACNSLIPHGQSVILNAPTVFRFTGDACPERHIEAAAALGASTKGVPLDDAGELLASQIIELMKASDVPGGLRAVGVLDAEIPQLVSGAIPQKRLIDNAPKAVSEADLHAMYTGAMTYYSS